MLHCTSHSVWFLQTLCALMSLFDSILIARSILRIDLLFVSRWFSLTIISFSRFLFRKSTHFARKFRYSLRLRATSFVQWSHYVICFCTFRSQNTSSCFKSTSQNFSTFNSSSRYYAKRSWIWDTMTIIRSISFVEMSQLKFAMQTFLTIWFNFWENENRKRFCCISKSTKNTFFEHRVIIKTIELLFFRLV